MFVDAKNVSCFGTTQRETAYLLKPSLISSIPTVSLYQFVWEYIKFQKLMFNIELKLYPFKWLSTEFSHKFTIITLQPSYLKRTYDSAFAQLTRSSRFARRFLLIHTNIHILISTKDTKKFLCNLNDNNNNKLEKRKYK